MDVASLGGERQSERRKAYDMWRQSASGDDIAVQQHDLDAVESTLQLDRGETFDGPVDGQGWFVPVFAQFLLGFHQDPSLSLVRKGNPNSSCIFEDVNGQGRWLRYDPSGNTLLCGTLGAIFPDRWRPVRAGPPLPER